MINSQDAQCFGYVLFRVIFAFVLPISECECAAAAAKQWTIDTRLVFKFGSVNVPRIAHRMLISYFSRFSIRHIKSHTRQSQNMRKKKQNQFVALLYT